MKWHIQRLVSHITDTYDTSFCRIAQTELAIDIRDCRYFFRAFQRYCRPYDCLLSLTVNDLSCQVLSLSYHHKKQ